MNVAVLSLTRDRMTIGTWDAAVVERFDAKIERRGHGECWQWTASLNSHGYGQFACPIRKRPIPASRFALELELGRALRPEHFALHTCDNPPCVNPNHLYEGTRSDNTQDSLRRGGFGNGRGQSFNVGARNGSSKLTEEDIRAIRASGLPARTLAERYRVTASNIACILRRQTWRHV